MHDRLPRFFSAPAALGLVLALSGAACATNLDQYDALINDGWAEQAKAELAEVVKREKDNARAHYLLAKASVKLGDYETADKHSEQAIKLEENAIYLLMRGDSVGLRARHGSKIKAIGRAKKCVAAYTRAAEIDPDNLKARVSVFAFNREAPGIAGGNKDRARAQLPEIARIKPMWGYFFRALWAIEMDEDRAEADRELFAAMAAYPDSHEPYDEYAKYLRRFDQPDSVIHYYREGIRRNPEPAGAHESLGSLLMQMERFDEAEAEFRAALAADPAYLSAWTSLSLNHQAQAQWQQSLAVLDTLQQAHPDYRPAHYQRGRTLLLAAQDLAAAEQAFRTYLAGPINTRWPSRAAAHWRLAQVLERRYRYQEAYEQAKVAAELMPAVERYKKDKGRLESMARDDY
jgi:tetratricopeptide (TPR) repeat protein